MRRVSSAVLLAALVACLAPPLRSQQREPENGWQTFEASWSAAGRRETLPTETGRTAVIMRLSGSLLLSRGEGLSRGFRAEAIGFNDGHGPGVGRAVWTDDRGDRVFSRITGDPAQPGRRIEGTFTGGTGRYTGVTGSYTFTWQYVMPSDSGTVQGRTVSFTGRYRLEPRR